MILVGLFSAAGCDIGNCGGEDLWIQRSRLVNDHVLLRTMEKTDYGIVPMRAYRGNFRPYYEQYKGSTEQKTGDSMVSAGKD